MGILALTWKRGHKRFWGSEKWVGCKSRQGLGARERLGDIFLLMWLVHTAKHKHKCKEFHEAVAAPMGAGDGRRWFVVYSASSKTFFICKMSTTNIPLF